MVKLKKISLSPTPTHIISSTTSSIQDDPDHIVRNFGMLDSGTTGNFISVQAKVQNILPTFKPITADVPNGEKIVSTHKCDINWPFL